MAKKWDAETIKSLKELEEVKIVTKPPDSTAGQPVTIWVVVVHGAVYVRSFTGPKGRWYQNILAHPKAELKFAGKTVHVNAVPVRDPKIIKAVSQAYLEKYRGSPYAKDMVKPPMLPTTLLLESA